MTTTGGLKIDFTTGKYKVYCMDCKVVITSYNYEPNAKRSRNHLNKQSNHYHHNIKIVEEIPQ